MSYNIRQQSFAFAQMITSTAKGTASQIASAIATRVDMLLADATVSKYVGTWTRAWGPVVWQAPGSDYADNTMMVLQSGSTLVVVIAGTNPFSGYDIKMEDLDVDPTVPFTYASSGNISTGTLLGLQNLLSMVDPDANTNLVSYLQLAAGSSMTLVFAGHSLGGALAPALALALFNPSGQMDGTTWSSVGVSATAGPSVGDEDFVALFSSTFPPTSELNEIVWNSLDVVPHAWSSDTFSVATIVASYPQITPTSCILKVLGSAVASAPNPNPYVQMPNSSFAGRFQDHDDPNGTGRFLAEAIYQHIMGYYTELIPELLDSLVPFNPYSYAHEDRLIMDDLVSKVDAYCSAS